MSEGFAARNGVAHCYSFCNSVHCEHGGTNHEVIKTDGRFLRTTAQHPSYINSR